MVRSPAQCLASPDPMRHHRPSPNGLVPATQNMRSTLAVTPRACNHAYALLRPVVVISAVSLRGSRSILSPATLLKTERSPLSNQSHCDEQRYVWVVATSRVSMFGARSLSSVTWCVLEDSKIVGVLAVLRSCRPGCRLDGRAKSSHNVADITSLSHATFHSVRGHVP